MVSDTLHVEHPGWAPQRCHSLAVYQQITATETVSAAADASVLRIVNSQGWPGRPMAYTMQFRTCSIHVLLPSVCNANPPVHCVCAGVTSLPAGESAGYRS